MAVTLREVAIAAGVSTAAVSKVLHGRGKSIRVSEERAASIRKIAEELSYRPNVLARNLRNGSTHTIGLVYEGFSGIADGPLYYLHLLAGIGEVLFKNHYRLTILPEIERDDILGSLGDGQLEGVIWCKLTRDPELNRLIKDCPIPIVALNAAGAADGSSAIHIACDNPGGMELAVAHLWDLGHRQIAFVNEDVEADIPDCSARWEGFAAAMQRRGVKDPECLRYQCDWRVTGLGDWLAQHPKTTATICWSESLAGRLMDQAKLIGLSIPQQLSVVGFDSTTYCETLTPRLTAVHQPIREMAARAAELIMDLIKGNSPESQSLIYPCTLDVRDSTAIPLKAEEAQ
jgi:LacI family transcriptional regulator